MIRVCMLVLMALYNVNAIGAVILQYHHVADNTPAVTSVSPSQFEQHMQYLAKQAFNVVPLSTVIESIRQQTVLPKKTVAITFDDGYQNIADNAHPILKKYHFPYTLFIAIEPIEKHYPEMMTWSTLQQLITEGAEVANHTLGHEHLIRRLPNENKSQWLERVTDNILGTEAELQQHIGQSLKILAYPYGEYNRQLQTLLLNLGFAGVGQQSGAVGIHSDISAIPRFPVAGNYASLDSLKVKLHSLAMPIIDVSPSNPELTAGNWRPQLAITLDIQDIAREQLMCFIQGQGAKKPQWESQNRFVIQADTALPPGRSRYNCTAPSKASGNYYWFSQPWVRPADNGRWLSE